MAAMPLGISSIPLNYFFSVPVHIKTFFFRIQRESFAHTTTETQLFSFCCDGLIVCLGEPGPGRTVMAFCRQPGVRGSIQNGCSLNRLGEFERRDANR